MLPPNTPKFGDTIGGEATKSPFLPGATAQFLFGRKDPELPKLDKKESLPESSLNPAKNDLDKLNANEEKTEKPVASFSFKVPATPQSKLNQCNS